MEYKMVTIPFDLETAKKINIGERVGQIVTEKGRNRAEIVYEDNSSICPLLVVIHSRMRQYGTPCSQKSKIEKSAGRWRVYTISWSIKFNGPLYGRTKQSIHLCFGISPLLDVVLVQY